MLTDIKKACWKEDTYYNLAFDDGSGNGFGFPCDPEGRVPDDLNDQAKKNLEWCLRNPDRFARYNEVVEYTQIWREPRQGTCGCGEVVSLVNEYMGACQCPKCGQWYNLSGQELLPPEEWGWDGTPMEEDW